MKVLVTYLMHLGDLVLTTPFIHALRKVMPDAQITMLVDEKLVDIVKYNPNLDKVITIDKKGRDDSIAALIRYARRLRQEKYDMLISLHPNERCSFLCAFSGAKYKVGAVHKIFSWAFDKVVPLDRKMHAADMYLDVLSKMGINDLQHAGLEMYTSKQDDDYAADFYNKSGVTEEDKLVGINIGSAVATKRWPTEKFAQVAKWLLDEGYRPVFFGGPGEVELVASTLGLVNNDKVINAAGKFSLGQLAAAIKRCRLFITNDSGPMHIAIAQQVPIVALYGPSNPKLYGPYTDKAIVVTAQPPCMGCQKRMKHACDSMDCMKRLTVNQVIDAAKRYLEEK